MSSQPKPAPSSPPRQPSPVPPVGPGIQLPSVSGVIEFGYCVHVFVVDLLHIDNQNMPLLPISTATPTVKFDGNVEITVFGKQTRIIVEFTHVNFGLICGTNANPGRDFGLKSKSNTDTGSGIMAIVGEIARIGRKTGKICRVPWLQNAGRQ